MVPWRIEHPLVFGAGVALLPGAAAAILQVARARGSNGLLLAALGVVGVTATHPSVMIALASGEPRNVGALRRRVFYQIQPRFERSRIGCHRAGPVEARPH
jgi:hypothetical protein